MTDTSKNIITDTISKTDGTTITFRMIKVEEGSFIMGDDEKNWNDEIRTKHEVELDTFYLAEFPVTQSLYEFIMGKNPSYFRGKDRPVERVSWEDAQIFIDKLNGMSSLENLKYRLPREAEWEYGAKDGYLHPKGTAYKRYSGSDKLGKVAWNTNNSHMETKSVGLLEPNVLGLYDMSGNVWEWCEDWYGEDYYENSDWKNPKGSENGSARVLRGVSWNGNADNCRSTARLGLIPTGSDKRIGFRLALVFAAVY